jgi:tetratricopeptide (TPR) repeat protein
MQDGYSRRRTPTDIGSVVLENDQLRAAFVPSLGGKLASLFHKPTSRELLHRNPVCQPANLALRNAWTSGGIEWNSGLPGHHYLTCAPVFAAEVTGPDGSPCLRIYEWDRVKGYSWQVDFWLPDGSAALFCRVRLVNPHPHEIAMYWWTNIAVDEGDDVRVLVPADSALCNPYWRSLEVVPLPRLTELGDSRDLTYSTRCPHAADFFSRIPDGRRRWVAALDGQGRGFFEVSTDVLRGRKLFCWGMGSGGRQWQEFLAEPGHAYIEIQAGLARTQMECLPMPAGAAWAWTEAFGYLEADPSLVHGDDWEAAWGAAADQIERIVPRAHMEEMDRALDETSRKVAARILTRGSGWGALERARKRRVGEPDGIPVELAFDLDSLATDQTPWMSLLTEGRLPYRPPEDEPGALMTQPEWGPLIEAGFRAEGGDHWLAWWHLGNLRMEARDLDGACDAWEESLKRARTGWALRNLAVAAQRQGRSEDHLRLMAEALEAGPQVASLAIEYAGALAGASRFGDVMSVVRSLPGTLRSNERILMLWARAALETGDTDGVEELFEHEFATIREGEVVLTDLWFAYHEKRLAREIGCDVDDAVRKRVRQECPPPQRIDFRMAVRDT